MILEMGSPMLGIMTFPMIPLKFGVISTCSSDVFPSHASPCPKKLGETLKSTHLNKSHYHACYKCWMLCACMGILLKIELNLELKDWIWCLSMLMKMLESRTRFDFKLLEPIDILEKVFDQHWICMHKFIGNTYQCCNGDFTLCFSIFCYQGWESLAGDQWRKHFL